MSKRFNLILIDGDAPRRTFIGRCLADKEIHVEPFENTREILERWPTADVILVEDSNHNILELFAHMAELDTWLPVIGFSEYPLTRRVVRAMQGGVIDYLAWPCETAEISTTLSLAVANEAARDGPGSRAAMARSQIKKLTKREGEVLAGIAGGLANRQIGEQLAISPRTVEIHRANLYKKIGAKGTSEAIRIAIEASPQH